MPCQELELHYLGTLLGYWQRQGCRIVGWRTMLHMQFTVARENFEAAVVVLAPEPYRGRAVDDAQIMQSNFGQPSRKHRIDVQSVCVRVGFEAENRAHEVED